MKLKSIFLALLLCAQGIVAAAQGLVTVRWSAEAVPVGEP